MYTRWEKISLIHFLVLAVVIKCYGHYIEEFPVIVTLSEPYIVRDLLS